MSAAPGFPAQQSIREKQTANVKDRTANSRNSAATNACCMLCHNRVASDRRAVLFDSSKEEKPRKSADLLNAVSERLLYVLRRSELPCEQAGCMAATRCYLGMIAMEFACVFAVQQHWCLCPRHRIHSSRWRVTAPQLQFVKSSKASANFTFLRLPCSDRTLEARSFRAATKRYFSHERFGFRSFRHLA